jgi:hypothetical protein
LTYSNFISKYDVIMSEVKTESIDFLISDLEKEIRSFVVIKEYLGKNANFLLEIRLFELHFCNKPMRRGSVYMH